MTIKFWAKAYFKKYSLRKYNKLVNYINVTSLTLYEIDCDSKTLRSLSENTYNSKGELLKSSNLESDWINVIPETISEAILEKACKLYN